MKEIISKILHSKIILTVFQAWHRHDYSSLYAMKWATIKQHNEFLQTSYHHDECAEGLCQDHSNAFILDLQHGDHSRCHMALNTVLHYGDFLFHFLALFLQYSPSVLLIQALWMAVIGICTVVFVSLSAMSIYMKSLPLPVTHAWQEAHTDSSITSYFQMLHQFQLQIRQSCNISYIWTDIYVLTVKLIIHL